MHHAHLKGRSTAASQIPVPQNRSETAPHRAISNRPHIMPNGSISVGPRYVFGVVGRKGVPRGSVGGGGPEESAAGGSDGPESAISPKIVTYCQRRSWNGELHGLVQNRSHPEKAVWWPKPGFGGAAGPARPAPSTASTAYARSAAGGTSGIEQGGSTRGVSLECTTGTPRCVPLEAHCASRTHTAPCPMVAFPTMLRLLLVKLQWPTTQPPLGNAARAPNQRAHDRPQAAPQAASQPGRQNLRQERRRRYLRDRAGREQTGSVPGVHHRHPSVCAA